MSYWRVQKHATTSDYATWQSAKLHNIVARLN